jgi:hypothetical protein
MAVTSLWPEDVTPTDRFGIAVEAIVEHPDFPGLRFFVMLAEDGRVVQWTIADRSLLAFPDETAEADDPSWGAVTTIGATTLRLIPFGEIERLVRARVGKDYSGAASIQGSQLTPADLKRLEDLAGSVGDSRRGALKSPADDAFYARIAQVYVEASKSKSPVKVVAEQVHYPRNTVANWLVEARRRELLTPTSPGRSGGVLTAKAEQVLGIKKSKRKAARP